MKMDALASALNNHLVVRLVVGDDFAFDDFHEGNVSYSHPASASVHKRSTPLVQLPDSLRDDIDQERCVWNYLRCFLDKIASHRRC